MPVRGRSMCRYCSRATISVRPISRPADAHRQSRGKLMAAGPLVVTYQLTERSKAIVAEELSGAVEAIYLTELPEDQRGEALARAGAGLANDTSTELQPG